MSELITPKVIISIAAVFLVALTTYFNVHRLEVYDTRFWIGMVMGGLEAVGAYLVGFWQVNPSLDKQRAKAAKS